MSIECAYGPAAVWAHGGLNVLEMVGPDEVATHRALGDALANF